ncbi:MAG TPA: TIGR04168 family protein [Thermosynechococcaceae cyanobacterium]
MQVDGAQGRPPRRSETIARVKIAVVGDVHDRWDAEDGEALRALNVDLVLLVGDFGNEAVDVVRSVAALDLPKAVILGNHDAWYSASEWGQKKSPYDRTQEDRVQQQLDLLSTAHVGYGKLDFPQFNLSVVGARPFSWGGSEWKNPEFYRSRYGIGSFEESTARIVAAAQEATYKTVIFIGHCGPLGLGDRPEDPCGRDWQPLGSDHGDPDFAEAIALVRQLGKAIPIVTFGHMHHQLRTTKTQLRTPVMAANGTVYINAASVPRIVTTEDSCRRNFTIVTLEAGEVEQVSLVWVDQNRTIASEQVLYRHPEPVNLASIGAASS